MRARLSDREHRIGRIPDRGRLRHPRRLREVPAVEQEPQQLRPFVPAPFTERGEQQVATARAEPAFLVARKEALPLGGESGLRVLSEQLAEPEPRGRVRRRFRYGPAEPEDRLVAPSEERESAAELAGRPGRRARRLEDGLEERQGSLVIVVFDALPRAFEDRRRRLTGDRRTKDAARLRDQAGLTELRRQIHPGRAGKLLVVLQQCGHHRPSLVIPAQDGEQPGTERQVVRGGGCSLESGGRRRIVEKPHVGLGAEAPQRRVRAVRLGRIQNRESPGEVLLTEQLADLGQQACVRLRRRGRPPQQQSEYERRHGRWPATLNVRASR